MTFMPMLYIQMCVIVYTHYETLWSGALYYGIVFIYIRLCVYMCTTFIGEHYKLRLFMGI